MPIEVKSEVLPSDKNSFGPPTCPPNRIEGWLASKLEKAQSDAAERDGKILGFIVKEADIEVEDERFGTVIASREHLFIAIDFPESS
jgi:hypothetical protein